MIPNSRLQELVDWVDDASSSGDTPKWKECHSKLTSIRVTVYVPMLEMTQPDIQNVIKGICFALRCEWRQVITIHSRVSDMGLSPRVWKSPKNFEKECLGKLPQPYANLLVESLAEVSRTEPVVSFSTDLLQALRIWQSCSSQNRCRIDVSNSDFRYLESGKSWKQRLGVKTTNQQSKKQLAQELLSRFNQREATRLHCNFVNGYGFGDIERPGSREDDEFGGWLEEEWLIMVGLSYIASYQFQAERGRTAEAERFLPEIEKSAEVLLRWLNSQIKAA